MQDLNLDVYRKLSKRFLTEWEMVLDVQLELNTNETKVAVTDICDGHFFR